MKLGRMKLGVIYPQIELRGDPRALDALARATEALGYDYFAMFDHVAGAVREGRDAPLMGPYSEQDPFHDPLVSFGYIAGITQRIELVTGIMVLPQRQTLLVARQAADVDLLSNGRLRLGVGAGWNHVEFAALGQDFHTRGRRMSEQIGLLRRLWAEPVVDFAGEFDRADRVGLNPRPNRQIPILCGGLSEPAYRRAARLADGFIFGGPFDRVLAGWDRVRAMLAEEGRPIAGFAAEYQSPDGLSVAETLDLARRWADAGGTHFAVRTMKLGYTEAQQHIDRVAAIQAHLP